ncbi:MAG: N-formylglutamate amidohydrolase [Polaribacter sp.]|uniref:N-formylglutamate amidohydrolase n=1 Tax=Polaribacter sp. TaxID=1920175 RepID=UPI003BB1AAD6
MKLILTCEHGGNEIPKKYGSYFKSHQVVLDTHRGFDLGALDVFNYLKPLANFEHSSTISRLLIELNRSLHHPNLFSEFTKKLSLSEKNELISTHYLPYRNTVENEIRKYINQNELVIHLSIHSFTPILNNVERNCDIGLLYDSRLPQEKQIATVLKDDILSKNNDLIVRYNYPYLGKADGFTSYLRTKFAENYVGIEVEINQKYAEKNSMQSDLKTVLFDIFSELFREK